MGKCPFFQKKRKAVKLRIKSLFGGLEAPKEKGERIVQ
jgi:hypothetical protein